MTFHDVRFPDDISYGASGGPGYNTDVITVKSGKERRNANWAMGRCSWDVSTGLKNQADLDKLIAFFRARLGKAYAFRFKDWTDYRMARQQVASGDGIATAFQLVKAYTDDGGYQVSRDITKPVESTVQIWLGDAPQASGWACDPLSGIVTFAAAPAAGAVIEASCQFDVPARFDTDQMKASIEAHEVFTWGSVLVTEVKE